MLANDRRSTHRRSSGASTASALGTALTIDRRGSNDRRRTPRRRADIWSIAQFAQRIAAGETRLEVIVDGTEGLRLVAVFACGCSATEPVGGGKPSVRIEACAAHTEPVVPHERRRG
jgi:hypothetical protein